jgi:hypothetical protein
MKNEDETGRNGSQAVQNVNTSASFTIVRIDRRG